MTQKARLSALVGLLAFFVPSSSYASGHMGANGRCYWLSHGISSSLETKYEWRFTALSPDSFFNPSFPLKLAGAVVSEDSGHVIGSGVTAWEWDGTKWVNAYTPIMAATNRYLSPAVYAQIMSVVDSTDSNLPASPPADFCQTSVCDTGDADGDGVCNSCDKTPSAPDPKDCVSLISRNAAGQVVDMDINVGCKQTSDPDYKIETYRDEAAAGADADARLYFGLYAQEREMDAKTCNASTPADADGNCACAYPPTNTKLAGFTDSSGQPAVISPDAEKEFETAQKLDDEDKLNDCAAVKNRCEAACSTRGGVVTNTCSSESGSLTSSCTCANNELAYDLDNESSDDSDNSSADSDGDGVPDSIDPDSTGGPDSNADNIDDNAAAVKGAIASLGLGDKLDAANGHLNSIGNSVSGLGSKIDGVGSAVSGLGSKIDGLGKKLDGISDKLDDGLEARGSADLPGTNEYNTDVENPEEQSFVDTVHNFLNSSLPVLSSISGSGLTASGSPSMSTELWGKTITLDFSDWQGVLRAAGLVLVAVATIFAFIIIL